MRNPWMSLWLSAANSWAGAMRGLSQRRDPERNRQDALERLVALVGRRGQALAIHIGATASAGS